MEKCPARGLKWRSKNFWSQFGYFLFDIIVHLFKTMGFIYQIHIKRFQIFYFIFNFCVINIILICGDNIIYNLRNTHTLLTYKLNY